MQFLRRSILGIGAFALAAALLLWAAAVLLQAWPDGEEGWRRSAGGRDRAMVVDIAVLEETRIAPRLTVHASVRSLQSAELRAEVAGRIVAVGSGVRDGASIREGMLIARLDPAPARTAKTRLELELEDIETEIRDATTAGDIARAELEKNHEALTLREAALDRQVTLSARGVALAGALEDAQLAVITTEQAILANRKTIAENETRLMLAATARARKESEIADAERALAATEIVAPAAGRWSGTTPTLGGLVSAQEALGVIIGTWPLEIAMRVPNEAFLRLIDDTGALRPLHVGVRWPGMGEEAAVVARLDRASVPLVEADAPQVGRLLYAEILSVAGPPLQPGDQVIATITEPELAGVFVLPAQALGPGDLLYLVGDDDIVETAPVDLLRRQGDEVIVRGAPAGRRYVATRLPGLTDGVRVRGRGPATTRINGVEVAGPAPAAADGSAAAGVGAGRAVVDPGSEPSAQSRTGSGRHAGGRGGGETRPISDEERARLVELVNANDRMPDRARSRILSILEQPEVPARLVERIERNTR
ncbi:MAG: hypothetical protein AAF899_06420 [Pseudomonadota bacterium]